MKYLLNLMRVKHISKDSKVEMKPKALFPATKLIKWRIRPKSRKREEMSKPIITNPKAKIMKTKLTTY